MKFPSDNSWVVLSPIEQSIKAKIEKIGKPLKEWGINIYRGVLTGYNEAFIIDGATKDVLIEKSPKNAEIIRPILRGRDIKRYKADFADLWLIYIPWHFPLHNDHTIKGSSEIAEQEFLKQYPDIYNHLLQHKEALSKRNTSETGIRYEWYALQRFGSNYMEDFSKQKIVWGEISDISKFALDSAGFLPEATAFLMTGNNLKYLLAILNSKLGEWLFNQVGTTTGVGTNRWKKYKLETLMVKVPSKEETAEIEQYIDIINNDTTQISKAKDIIDNLIYNLYDLSNDESDFIESLYN